MADIGYNPLNVVPYKREDLQAFLDRGLPEFRQRIRGWYRDLAMAFYPDKAPPDKKETWGDWFKIFNEAYSAIEDTDERAIQEWIKTQHSGGGANDELLALAAQEIESLEARLNSALTALNRGRPVTPAELLKIVDPDYGVRVEQLQRENRNFQGRVRTAESNASTYQQQVTDANARARTAEGEVNTYRQRSQQNEQRAIAAERAAQDAKGESAQYLQEAATQKQRADSSERSAQELRVKAKTLEERLSAETSRAQLAESRLGTANDNLAHARDYAQGIFTQLQEAQGLLAAIEAAGRAAGVDPSMPNEQIFQEGIRLLRQEKGYQKSIGVFRFLLGRDPSNAEIYVHLGIAHRDANQKELAVEQFQRALDINPKHSFAQKNRDKLLEELYQKGIKLRAEKKHQEAIGVLETVVRYVPKVDAYANLGAAYRDLGEREKAIRYFRRALEFNPNHQFSRQNLSRLEDITNLDYRQRIRVIGAPDSPQEAFQQNVPVYAVSSAALKEAFRYLFTDNPEVAGKGRLERLVYLFGSGDGDIRKIEGIAYPRLTEQHAAHASAEQTDSNKILIALDEKSLAWYGMAHNHNWAMFNETGSSTGAVSPSSVVDMPNHERIEQAYKTFLTVIFSPDGYAGFWQPREFEMFVDGKKLPASNIPNLMEHVKVYKLN